VFVTVSHFHPGRILVGKARSATGCSTKVLSKLEFK
jgi:hypothetical protein